MTPPIQPAVLSRPVRALPDPGPGRLRTTLLRRAVLLPPVDSARQAVADARVAEARAAVLADQPVAPPLRWERLLPTAGGLASGLLVDLPALLHRADGSALGLAMVHGLAAGALAFLLDRSLERIALECAAEPVSPRWRGPLALLAGAAVLGAIALFCLAPPPISVGAVLLALAPSLLFAAAIIPSLARWGLAARTATALAAARLAAWRAEQALQAAEANLAMYEAALEAAVHSSSHGATP